MPKSEEAKNETTNTEESPKATEAKPEVTSPEKPAAANDSSSSGQTQESNTSPSVANTEDLGSEASPTPAPVSSESVQDYYRYRCEPVEGQMAATRTPSPASSSNNDSATSEEGGETTNETSHREAAALASRPDVCGVALDQRPRLELRAGIYRKSATCSARKNSRRPASEATPLRPNEKMSCGQPARARLAVFIGGRQSIPPLGGVPVAQFGILCGKCCIGGVQ